MLAGAMCAAIAAVMTALKTGDDWLWPCVALLIVTGAVARASTCAATSARKSALTADEAARWEMRYQIGAMLYAARARDLVLGRAARAATMPSRT